MRKRDMTWSDYGLDKQRVKEICTMCRQPENYELVKTASIDANLLIYDLLTINLVQGIGYAKLSKKHEIPISEKGFIGYRRAVVAALDKKFRR